MSNKSKQGWHQAEHAPKERWLPHRDWRVYVAVVLMLIAMVVYLATMDEALAPIAPADQPVPADSAQ